MVDKLYQSSLHGTLHVEMAKQIKGYDIATHIAWQYETGHQTGFMLHNGKLMQCCIWNCGSEMSSVPLK